MTLYPVEGWSESKECAKSTFEVWSGGVKKMWKFFESKIYVFKWLLKNY